MTVSILLRFLGMFKLLIWSLFNTLSGKWYLSRDLMQCPSKFQQISSQRFKGKFSASYGNTEILG